MRKIILAKQGSSKDVIDDTSTFFFNLPKSQRSIFGVHCFFFLCDYFEWCKLCFGDTIYNHFHNIRYQKSQIRQCKHEKTQQYVIKVCTK
jgi:hypothetical protein